jgi:Dolichyl-phosphate-mannose-protein mannosyltransferase
MDKSIAEQPASPTIWTVVIGILIGISLRCIEVTRPHGFDFDDAMLALNIVSSSVHRLAGPLAYQQSAPVLFLWMDRVLVDVVGVHHVVLRLLPLIGGIVMLPLAWVVGRQLVPEPAAALAVTVLAVSPLTVDYTDRAKPYTVDAAVALALIALTLAAMRAPARRERWIALTAAGILAPLLSTPSAFTLVACGAALVVALLRAMRGTSPQPHPPWLVVVGVWCVVWFVAAAVNYLVFQRSTSHDPYLQRFWSLAYFTPGPGILSRIRAVASSFVEDLFYGATFRPNIVFRLAAAALAVTGAVWIARRSVTTLILLVGPLVCAIVAAVVRIYPPSDRTWLFAAPSVAILGAVGLYELCALVSTTWGRRATFAAASLLALYLPVRESWLAFLGSRAPDPVESSVQAWTIKTGPREPVYVFARDAIRWTYYTTNWRHPDAKRLHWLMSAASAIGPNSGNVPSRGHAVNDEGDSLAYHGADRTELIGVPTGMEDRVGAAPPPIPDSGWADNEARRVAAAANPTIWMYFLYCKPAIDSMVIAAAERRGAHLVESDQFRGARLYRLRFE